MMTMVVMMTITGSKLSVTPACDMPFYCKKKRTKEQRDQRRAGRTRTKDAGEEEEQEKGKNDEEGREGEAKVAICNLQPTDKDHEADLVIHHACDEVMTALLDVLNQRRTAAPAEEPTTAPEL